MAALGWYEGALLVSAAVSLAVAGATLRYRDQPGAIPLAVLLSGAALWSASTFGKFYAELFALARFFNQLVYVGTVAVVLFFLLFALEFVGLSDRITRRLLALLAVEPAVILVLVWGAPAGGDLLRHVRGPNGVYATGTTAIGWFP